MYACTRPKKDDDHFKTLSNHIHPKSTNHTFDAKLNTPLHNAFTIQNETNLFLLVCIVIYFDSSLSSIY